MPEEMTMGYQGYKEFICYKGHYSTASDTYGNAAVENCEICGNSIAYRHSVDLTNGSDEEQPSTVAAPKEEVGFEEDWHEDHRGNKYALKILHYKPNSPVWIDVEVERTAVETERRLDEANRRWSLMLTDVDSWDILNEYDEVTETFKFLTDVDDVSLVHEFTSQEAAERALRIVTLAMQRNAEVTNTQVQQAKVFFYDLRKF